MRISLSIYDADHIYELALENFQEGCLVCDKIKKRFENFLGNKRVSRIKKTVKDNPYND